MYLLLFRIEITFNHIEKLRKATWNVPDCQFEVKRRMVIDGKEGFKVCNNPFHIVSFLGLLHLFSPLFLSFSSSPALKRGCKHFDRSIATIAASFYPSDIHTVVNKANNTSINTWARMINTLYQQTPLNHLSTRYCL